MSTTHPARSAHPIFTDAHEALRESIRAFMDREVAPHVDEWEEQTFPDLWRRRVDPH